MNRFLKLLAIYVLPVWLFDTFANRDPAFYLDGRSQLVGASGRSPLIFSYRDPEKPRSESYHLPDITDFLIGDSVYTGKTGHEYFIVRKSDGYQDFFRTVAERDLALARDYSTELVDMKPQPWYSGLQANAFYPYNLIYYFGVTGTLAGICLFRHKAHANPNPKAHVGSAGFGGI